MDAAKRQQIEETLSARGLMPLAHIYQDAITAAEPAYRFSQWLYVYEVLLKGLSTLAWGRSRERDDQPPELLYYVRDNFYMPSQGHWRELLASTSGHLKKAGDIWGRNLTHALVKKTSEASILEILRITTELQGNTERNFIKVSVDELVRALNELRNKTQGHGAPRQHFYEDTNTHLEESILFLLESFEPFWTADLLQPQQVEMADEHWHIQGLLLRGLRKQPWQGIVASKIPPQVDLLLALGDEGEDIRPIYLADPLLLWDSRSDGIGIYNGYSENRQRWEYLNYGRGDPIHKRGRSFLTAFGLPATTLASSPRLPTKLWSDKGVALYPVDTALVGQNQVFNALFKFRRKFGQTGVSNFFALIGDWGLGKSRIGLELFAESFNQVDQWLLNPDDPIAPNSQGRLLAPSLADGVLPLWIRYDMACAEDLYANNWIPRLATQALSLVVEGGGQGRVSDLLLSDLRLSLQSKGVDLSALKNALISNSADESRLKASLDVLRLAGIEHLWVVVDEIETPGDYNRRMHEEGGGALDSTYLTLVADVFRHENLRSAQPFYANVNFLLLCSEGMRDKLEIGPSRRRDDVVTLLPNRLSDVRRFQEHLKDRAAALGQSVDYPVGTIEAAFMASNRNFGWFNVLMSSIHDAFQVSRADGRSPSAAELVEQFARNDARARWVFAPEGIDLLRSSTGLPVSQVNQLVFGQVPVRVGTGVTTEQAETILQARLAGLQGPAFAELFEVQIEAGTLAEELVRPEIGFRLVNDMAGAVYEFYNTRINLVAMLSALQAFSVAAEEKNFLAYVDRAQFAVQLKALYPEPNIEQAADVLYKVFSAYRLQDRQYIAPSFSLLQRVDQLLSRETQHTTFFKDSAAEERLERHVRDIVASDNRRQQAICEGFAKLLDDGLLQVQPVRSIQSTASVSFTSQFQSPRLDGLRVTREGRLTVVYCRDSSRLAGDLAAMLGSEAVHPLVVLISPYANLDDFQRAIERFPVVQRCMIARQLNGFEEEFLIKYSGRGTLFQNQPLSDWALSRSGAILQEWKRKVEEWHAMLEESGYLIKPIWYSDRGISAVDFHAAYRLMLINDWNLDQIAPDTNRGFDGERFEQVRNACRKNVEPPANKPRTLAILSDEPYQPTPPTVFGALLYELRQQTSLEALQARFFFAGPAELTPTKQVEQILELLKNLGVVTHHANLYRAVNRDLLRQYRETASAWLSGPARSSVDEMKDWFLSKAQELETGDLRFADDDLARVENLINQIDFKPILDNPLREVAVLKVIVKQVTEIEDHLRKVCPPAIFRREGQSPVFTPEQIHSYEERFNHLSVWEKVGFLSWLRQALMDKREQISAEIQRQLSEAQSMQNIQNSFPVSALTQPLKALEQELAPVSSGAVTVLGRITVVGYPYELRRYLITGKYEDAWRRLEALGQLVERNHPESIWGRFKGAYDRWQAALRQFEQARSVWSRLSNFMSDAPDTAWTGAEQVRADYLELEQVINVGLQQQINGLASTVAAQDLVDELSSEVDGYSRKIQGLASQIDLARSDIERMLKAILNLENLRALNEILNAQHQSELKPPEIADTYVATKQRFENFNVQVNDRGKALFEGINYTTTWALWLEIYQELSSQRYIPRLDHQAALTELEQMGVIIRTVKLRR